MLLCLSRSAFMSSRHLLSMFPHIHFTPVCEFLADFVDSQTAKTGLLRCCLYRGKTECLIAFAVKGIMAKRALDWQEDHAQLRYGGKWPTATSTWARSTTDICVGSLDVLRQSARSLAPPPRRDLRNKLRAISCSSDDRRLWPVSMVSSFLPQDRGQFLRSASSVCSMPPSLHCFVLWRMSSLGRGGPTDAELRKQLRLSCRQLDCDIYHAYFAMLRPRCVPS